MDLVGPDDRDFEEIYRSVPVGLTVTAAKLDHSETLRSFCYSLKGAAIRLGSNAMFFLCGYGNRQWLTKGIQHFRRFVEKHKTYGVRLFLIDQSRQSPAYVNREVAQLIREFSESVGVSVIVTVVAERAEQGDEKRLAVLEGGVITFFARSAIALKCSSTKRLVRSESQILRDGGSADAAIGAASARKIQALSNLAERPGTEPEGKLAKEILARIGLRNRSTPERIELKWVFEQTETILASDFYSATTVFGGQEIRHSPLYFLKTCPQPPDQRS